MQTASRMPTLAAALTGGGVQGIDLRGVLRAVVLVIVGSALLTISAKIQQPFQSVPATLQPFAVLLIGAAFGARLAAATVIAYLAQGAAGLPVFASGAGLAYMAGPTGGYLAGFLLAAIVVGCLAERGWDRSVGRTALAMVLGLTAIYACGVFYLSGLIGLEKAIQFGFVPFILHDLAEAALAAFLLPAAWRLIGR